MIDNKEYRAKPGRLSDIDIAFLCKGENPMISPFSETQQGKPSFGLSSAGYDFTLGAKYYRQTDHVMYLDREEEFWEIDPLNKEHQEAAWRACEAENDVIFINPLECLLTETVEKINMPDDVVAEVLGKSTYARCGLLVNATPLEPGWRGVITLELHNCSPIYPIMLRVGQGISQGIFTRMANPPARTYGTRETAPKYQDQQGVTLSK